MRSDEERRARARRERVKKRKKERRMTKRKHGVGKVAGSRKASRGRKMEKQGASEKDRGPEAVGKELVTQCRQESAGAM